MEIQNIAYEGHKGVQERLRSLYDVYELSWPVIAALDEFAGIPFSTLRDIYKTGIVPKKWRHRFPGVGAVDDRPRISIHKENMHSAAQTIFKNLHPQKVAELTQILESKIQEKTYT